MNEVASALNPNGGKDAIEAALTTIEQAIADIRAANGKEEAAEGQTEGPPGAMSTPPAPGKGSSPTAEFFGR